MREPARPAATWPVWLIWLLLVAASVAGFLLAEGLAPPRIAGICAILLAAIKTNIVFSQYMEVRWTHRPLRLALSAWLAMVTVTLLSGYAAI